MARVLIAGGGTGGHLNLGLAIAEALEAEANDSQIHFVACRPETDPPLLLQESRPFDLFPVVAPPRTLSPRLFKAAWSGIKACRASLRLIRFLRPQVVVGTGAYGSAAPILAARLAKVPIVLFEPEIEPGLATRLLAPLSRAIACAHAHTLIRIPLGRARLTGMPLRKAFLTINRRQAREDLGLRSDTPFLVCSGGSQGARSLNRSLWEALPALFRAIPGLAICHTTGSLDYAEGVARLAALSEEQRARYRMVERLSSAQMAQALAAADVAVTRTGANTVAELEALNVPAVLVPYPFATGAHQRKNADTLLQSGQALLLENRDLNAETVVQHVLGLLRSAGAERPTRQERGRTAAKRVAALIRETATEAS